MDRDRMMIGRWKILDIAALFILIYYAVDNRNILFDMSNRAYIFIILSLAIYLIDFHFQATQKKDKRKKDCIITIIETLLIDFSYFGYHLFIGFHATNISIFIRIALFLAGYIWSGKFLFVIQHAFQAGSRMVIGDRLNDRGNRLLLFLIVFIPSICMSVIFYPGVISHDSNYLFEQACNLSDISNRSDIHSFAFVLILYVVSRFTNNVYVLVLINIVCFSLIWSNYIMFLCENGLQFRVGVFLSLLWVVIPSNLYIIQAVWKDIPFTISLLGLTYYITKFVFNKKIGKDIKWNILVGIFIFLTAIFRSNGLFVSVMLILLLLPISIQMRFKKMVIMCMVSTACILAYKGPFFHVLQVSQTPASFAAEPFWNGVWINIVENNKLPPQIEKDMFSIMPKSQYLEYYTEDYVHTYLLKSEERNRVDLNTMKDNYVWCLIHHPFTTIKERFRRTSSLWSAFPATATVQNVQEVYTLMYENNFGWKYIDKLYPLRLLYEKWYNDRHIAGSFFSMIWRAGFWLIVIIIACLEQIRQHKKGFLIMSMPVLSSTFALLIACCYPDYRYGWPIMVIGIPLVASYYIYDNLIGEQSDDKL